MNNQKEQQSKTFVNLKALSNVHYLCNTLQGSHAHHQSINIEFDNYQELGTHLNGIIKLIEILALSDNYPAKDVLPLLSSLTHFAKQLVPFGELQFLDELLISSDMEFKQKEQTFKEISTLNL